MTALIGTLEPHAPYDFHRSAACASYYTVLGQYAGGVWRRLLRVGPALALIEVASRGTVDRPALDVRLLSSTGRLDANVLLRRVGLMLAVDARLELFFDWAQTAAPPLNAIAASLYGLHCFQTETPFEAFAVTVIEQQIALASAQKGERWLMGTFGDGLEFDGVRYATFPTPATLAALSLADLTPLKITFRRMQVLIDSARAHGATLEAARSLPPDEVYRLLMGMKGVGHWTAAWTLTRGLGHYAYVGSADVALRAAVNHYMFGQKGRAATDTTDALFAGCGVFAGLMSFFMLMRWALDRYPRQEAVPSS